jgi:hypothetical protein
MESKNNLEFICSDCFEEQIQKFNENLPDVKPGDYIKAAFKTVFFDTPEEGPPIEHMWVLVKEILPEGYKGELYNEPHWCPDVKLHDEVTVKHSQCSNHLVEE